MINHLFGYLALTLLLIISLVGCVTAGIVNPNDPLIDPCVIVTTDSDISVYYDDTMLVEPRGRFYNVASSGEHQIRVSESKRYIVDVNNSPSYITTTFIPYTEVWDITYEFKQGMSYKIEVENAKLSYDGTYLSSMDSGVRIEGNADGKNIFVIHDNGENINIIERNGGINGYTYIGPYFGNGINISILQYGSSIFVPSVGPRFGLNILHSNLGIVLTAEAGIELGFTTAPNFRNFGVVTGYHAGVLAEIYFRKIGFGVGGGITQGILFSFYYAKNDDPFPFPVYSFPYAEFNVKFDDENFLGELNSAFAFFFRYYFNDVNESWYNKFSTGLKFHW